MTYFPAEEQHMSDCTIVYKVQTKMQVIVIIHRYLTISVLYSQREATRIAKSKRHKRGTNHSEENIIKNQ